MVVVITMAVAALALWAAAFAFWPRVEIRPRPAPVGVWNDSDNAVTIALVGAGGESFFLVPPHGLGTIAPPPEIGSVQRLAVVDKRCRTDRFSQRFDDWSHPFSWGGMLLVRDGGQGWDDVLPPFWAEPLGPLAGGCVAAS